MIGPLLLKKVGGWLAASLFIVPNRRRPAGVLNGTVPAPFRMSPICFLIFIYLTGGVLHIFRVFYPTWVFIFLIQFVLVKGILYKTRKIGS